VKLLPKIILATLLLITPALADKADLNRFERVISLLTERSRYQPSESALRGAAGDNLAEARAGDSTLPEDLEEALSRAEDHGELQKRLINSMLESLDDPWARLYTPAESQKLRERMGGGRQASIGLALARRSSDKQFHVIGVEPSSPAWGKIKLGEVIVAANGLLYNDPKFRNQLRGKSGSQLTLRVASPTGVVRNVSLTRADYRSKTAYLVEDQPGVIRVSSFGKNTAAELKEALLQVGDHPVVIDLRYNGGGYLDAAVECADLFLPQGKKVVTVVDHRREIVHQTDETPLYERPISIIVNDKTASAAEIFTAALDSHTDSYVVGDKTFGKGSVQRFVGLPGEWALKYTVSLYKTPDDVFIDQIGIEPDLRVDMDSSFILGPSDSQLAAARHWLVEKSVADTRSETRAIH